MIDREEMLLVAIKKMTDQYPVYCDHDQVVAFLISDERAAGREDRLLRALVRMADRLLENRDGQVDTLAQSAGEHTVAALASFGLMEFVHPTRFARWTEAGKAYLAETAAQWPALTTRVATTRQRRQLRWSKQAAVAASAVILIGSVCWLLSRTLG